MNNLYKIEIIDHCTMCSGMHFIVADGAGEAINKLINAIKETADIKNITIKKVELFATDIIV